MTISTFDSRRDYTGNGVATFFEFDVPVLNDPVGLVVYVNSILVTNYSVQSNGINFTTPPAFGARILIVLGMELNQLRDWYPFGPFPAAKTEDAADKLIVLKGGALTYGRYMNLSVLQTIGDVTLVNDKGQDAIIPLWHHTNDEAGAFSCTVAEQIPLDGSPTNTPESHAWISFPSPVPPDEPTAIVADSTIPAGQVMTAMNFSGLSNAPQISRSHPLGDNLNVRDFTAFHCFRWTDEEAGEIWDSEMFEFFAAKRPATAPEEFYFGWSIYDAQSLPTPRTTIQGNTVELGNLLLPGGLADIGDWIVYMWSMKDIHVPDPDRFTAWVVNLTKGTETEVNTDGVHWDSSQAGNFGMADDTERSLSSRMGFLNNRSGDVTGAFGFSGTMGPHGFQFGQALDFSQPSERAKICSPTELTDHGVGGVNIFGQQAAYYSQGDPQLNTGWINTGNPSVFNQAVFGTGADLPPYDYPVTVHSMGDWEYDNMALADASGDPWLDGQQIFITEGNQVMLYRTSLAVDGHNGLIHRFPFFSYSNEFASATVIESQAEGVDPSTWGWVETSSGVLGVDYALDVVGGRARIAKLTTDGAVSLEAPHALVAGDETTFAILDRITGDNANVNEHHYIALNAGDGITNASSVTLVSQSAQIPVTPPLDTWGFQMPGEYENTTLNHDTENRLWIYTNVNQIAIWSDIGPMLFWGGSIGAFGSNVLRIQASRLADTGASDFTMGRVVIGRLTP